MNRPIEQCWQLAKETIHLPPDPGNEEYLEKLRLIYFAGAMALYKLIISTDDEDTEKFYDDLDEEYKEFYKGLRGN